MFRRLASFVIATVLAAAAHAGVDANRAAQADLESVRGIGPGLSARIVQARADAPFKDWPDLIDRVSGIGPRSAARYSQAGLTVAGASYEASVPAANAMSDAAKPKAKGDTSPRRSRAEGESPRKPRNER